MSEPASSWVVPTAGRRHQGWAWRQAVQPPDALVATLAGPAWAQSDKPPLCSLVRLPFGGSADVIACRRAERLQAELGGQTAGADNAPGAAGRIAIKALKAATHGNPDVITSSGPVVLFARVFRRPGCDLARDLAPISQLARVQFGIAAGPLCKCKGRSMAEVLTKAKVDPHAASGGASGNGRLQHFLGLLIGDASRVWLPP